MHATVKIHALREIDMLQTLCALLFIAFPTTLRLF